MVTIHTERCTHADGWHLAGCRENQAPVSECRVIDNGVHVFRAAKRDSDGGWSVPTPHVVNRRVCAPVRQLRLWDRSHDARLVESRDLSV